MARRHRFKLDREKLLRLALTHHRLTIPAREFLDAASGVDEFLFTSKKRMAGGTNTNLDIAASRPSAIDGATCASDCGLCVVRMDISLHVCKKEVKAITQFR
jgi:hypothetical protein